MPDALGSVRQLANASGSVTLARSYEPYGSVMTSAGSGTTNYNFAGEWADATNLIYLRARYYSGAQGRFLTADTWPGDYQRPLTLNKWNYTESNPVNRTDPSGRSHLPRLSGICAAPPFGETGDIYALEGFVRQDEGGDHVYIYCGEFKLTAYQFAENIGYPQITDANRTTAPDGTAFSLDFVQDVQLNGTGHADNICSEFGGYFQVPPEKLNVANRTFIYVCGKGQEFLPSPYTQGGDAFEAVAADRTLFPKWGTELYLPELARRIRGWPSYFFTTKFFVKDAGLSIQRYRLDIFAGQGPGPRSPNEYYGESPAARWLAATEFLGRTKTDDGFDANGPTPVYQKAEPPWDQIYRNILCGDYVPPPGVE